MMSPQTTATAAADRIESLDILRGWAVFGMLIVNVGYFSRHPLVRPEGLDVVVAVLVQFLADDKFWTLFSVLFGYGFVLHFDRSTRRGEAFVPLYVRRLLVLGLFGLAHSTLHPAEVLHRYALLGFLLVGLRSASTSTLVTAGVASLLATIAFPGRETAVDPALRVTVFSDGSLWDVLAFNASRFWRGVLDTRLLEPFPYFVVGVWLGRRRLLHGDTGRLAIRRARWWAFGLGVLLQGCVGLMAVVSSASARRFVLGVASALVGIGSGLFGLFYASVIVLGVARPDWRRRLQPLAAVGRLALTNYLLQTVVITTLLYGYGFGLYGRIGMRAGVLTAVIVFGLQTLGSVWWVGRFRQGPAEWLWRSLAGGRWLPIFGGSPYNDAA